LLLCFKTIGAQSYGQLALKILCMTAKGGCCSTGVDKNLLSENQQICAKRVKTGQLNGLKHVSL
jgi:hypothetical protein